MTILSQYVSFFNKQKIIVRKKKDIKQEFTGKNKTTEIKKVLFWAYNI